jgi:hypothetical protein
MAAGSTYTPIATTTLGSAQATIDFTSIPSTYTDLHLVISAGFSAAYDLRFRINGSSSSIYSQTYLYGTGSAAGSTKEIASLRTYGQLDYYGAPSANLGYSNQLVDFMNYSNSTTYKTILCRSNRADSGTDAVVALVQTTSAINQITLYCGSNQGNFITGSTATLYGIAAA